MIITKGLGSALLVTQGYGNTEAMIFDLGCRIVYRPNQNPFQGTSNPYSPTQNSYISENDPYTVTEPEINKSC